MRKLNIMGKKFTRLLVVAEAEKNKGGHLQYLCQCDCGNTTILPTGALTSGNTKSCGCLFKDMDRSGKNNRNYGRGENIRGKKHPNYKHGLSGTKPYEAYVASIRRQRKKDQIAPNFNIEKVALIYQVCNAMNKESNETYVVDHIKPLSRGGLNGQDNLQILSRSLNAKKWAKWPLTEEERIKYTGITLVDIEKGGGYSVVPR